MSKITKEQELQEARNLLSDHDSVINKEDYDYIDKVLYKCMNTIFPEQPNNPQVEEVIKKLEENSIEIQSMYEENMECLGYHLNGETEPLNNFLANLHDTKEIIEILKKAHTPSTPTEEEVCKALSEYYNKRVIFLGGRFRMITDRLWCIDLNSLLEAPDIITMIGQFYESELSK